MKSLTGLLLAALASGILCLPQSLRQDSRSGVHSPTATVQRKGAVERHFESLQPQPLLRFGGARPGVQLLDEHRLRSARLQQRIHAGQIAHPQAAPEGAVLPGILQRSALAAGALPTSVATGDFNRDGHADFVVANGLDNDLWIYFGKGDGTFQLPQVVPLSKGLSPVCIAAADLRGNGILDLVVAESDTSTIGVLLGNGDGTFGYETEYELPQPPGSIVIDDFNHDGKPDVAAAMVTNLQSGSTNVPYIALLQGDGTGKLAAPVITYKQNFESSAWNIASGDVNNDGLPDILLTGPGWENSQVFINNGDGTFTPGATVIANDPDSGIPFLADGRLGDINGDGCADAVVADINTMVWVALGDCTGKFSTPVAVYMGSNNAAVRLIDVNGDGHLDLVTSEFPAYSGLGMVGGNSLNVALGDGKGNFGAAREYVGTGQSYSIGFADFNGDGKPDFVTAESDTDTATVYLNDGAGGFGFPQGIYAGVAGQITIDAPYSGLSFADLNGDGKSDAILLDVEGTSAEVYAVAFLNDGTGRFTGPIPSDMGISRVTNPQGDYRLGNFRNSGVLDMVAIGTSSSFSTATQYILYLKGNGDGTFAKATPVMTAGAEGILATGDFNHDGNLDFVAVDGLNSHTLTTFLGNGNGTFHALAPIAFSDTGNSTGGTYPLRAWTGDFNRDGKLDVLVFTSGNGYWTNESTVWEFDGNGDGTFQTPRQLFTGFQPMVLADLNGDHYPDIARYDFMWPDGTTTTLGPAKFTNYMGQADGTFAESSSYAPYAGLPESVQPFQQNGDPLASSLVADFKGNGVLDEVAFQQPPNFEAGPTFAQFLMGNGGGNFTPTYDIFPFYYGYPLYAHDLDGDGIADMLEVDNGTSSLRVFKGGRAPALQIALEDSVVSGNQSCGWVFPDVASASAESVTLSSSVPGVILPSSVSIPAGAISARFCYTLTSNYDWRQVFDVKAQLNGDTATAYASSSYSLGFSEVLSPASVAPIYAGQSSSPITLTLTASQGYSSTVHLSCAGSRTGDSCQFASNTLDVSPGAPASTTVTLIASPALPSNGTEDVFTITAGDDNIIQRQTLTLDLALLEFNNSGGTFQVIPPATESMLFGVNGIPPYTFGCSGLPAGVTCAFSGNQAAYPQTSSITLAMNIPAGTPAGNYPFTMTIASGTYSTSAPETLQVISYGVQGPPAANDWILAGSTMTIPVTVQGSSNSSGTAINVSLACALDVTATCAGGSSWVSATANTADLILTVPSGTSLGEHQLTVTSTYNGSTQSYTFPIYVVALSGSLSGSSLTIPRGGPGALTLALNATTGFSGSVALSCSGASPQISCSFSPSPVQLTGGTPQTVTMNLTAGATAQLHPTPATLSARGALALAMLFPAALWWGVKRRRGTLLLSLAVCALLSSVASCGSGGSVSSGGSGSGGSGAGGGGGSNSYSVTVNATVAGTSQTYALGTVTVIVTH
jgi:hypothetical protein